jgi:hypothetical protein
MAFGDPKWAQCDHEWVQTAPNQKRCSRCGVVLTFA